MTRGRSLWPAIAIAGALVALVGSAAATDVRGSIRVPDDYLPQPSRDAEERAFYWEEWNGFLDPRPRRVDLRREITIGLIGAAAPADLQPAVVRLSGGSLSPATIVVAPGTTIRIENRDDFPHELLAPGLDGFSNEVTSSNQARAIRITRPGAWPIRDRLVPHVRGHLHVVQNLVATAQPDADGRFIVRGVTPGTYTMKVYHLDREVTSQPVEVPESRELALDPITLSPARAARPAR